MITQQAGKRTQRGSWLQRRAWMFERQEDAGMRAAGCWDCRPRLRLQRPCLSLAPGLHPEGRPCAQELAGAGAGAVDVRSCFPSGSASLGLPPTLEPSASMNYVPLLYCSLPTNGPNHATMPVFGPRSTSTVHNPLPPIAINPA